MLYLHDDLINNPKYYFMSKLLLGFTAGIIVGVLFAPDKGSATRRKIADTGSDLKDKFNDFIDGLTNSVDDLKDEAEGFADKAKAQFKNETN
jgi:gas vesicle protein